jgi:hypothetical protein
MNKPPRKYPEAPKSIEAAVLRLVLDNFEGRPWTPKELGRQIDGDVGDVAAALTRLCGNELLYYVAGFVIPSRAALAYSQLVALYGHQTQMRLL